MRKQLDVSGLITEFFESPEFERLVYWLGSLGLPYLFLLWFTGQGLLRVWKRSNEDFTLVKQAFRKLAWLLIYVLNGILVYRLNSTLATGINIVLFLFVLGLGIRELVRKNFRAGGLKLLFGLSQLVLLGLPLWVPEAGLERRLFGLFIAVPVAAIVIWDLVGKFEELDEL